MTISTVRMMSHALQRPSTYTVILPNAADAGPGPYHVLLQLHGYGDDHSAWIYKSNIARYLERVPLIAVFPDGENSYWSNWEPTRRYEDLLIEDLWAHVQATYAVVPASRWAIGGLSMGGFGALRLGLKHADRFASIFGHSSFIPSPTEMVEWIERSPWWSESFKETVRAQGSPYQWAAAVNRAQVPRLGFDCGVDDELLGQNRRFHAYLESIGLPHTYIEHPGGHTWDYWDRHVHTALQQHCKIFGLPYHGPSGERD